ncbi:MAG: type II and III secretion system protein family protein [Phenylobacterium sp.]|uniref:type II and III secretion system protein family protein n=1 Tax=Phenylobacterium sp. TaxID=1871053 RepID=UPI0027359C5F|nr:type II and III secretion system protein family protein [Phenylobacterium sp.]MDP3173178.1 type II and III secretion system protein family protein [Phenylobacterium sp.]
MNQHNTFHGRWTTTLRAAVIALAAGVGALSASVAQAQSGDRYELVVPIGQSQVLELDAPYTELMIANPEIADVLPLSTRSVYVVGKKLGSTALSIYGPGRRLLNATNVVVSADVASLKVRLHEIMPDETGIAVRPANESIVLSGAVSSGPKLQQAVALAESYAPGKVVNMLSVQGAQQVMLSVRFVEMERSTSKALRISTEAGDIGGSKYSDVQVRTGDTLLNTAGSILDSIGLTQLLFRGGDTDIRILFDALEKKGLVKTLAEPTLVASSGDTANFLAGGEFPIPVARNIDDNDNTTITVEFKQFGISLGFTPTVLDDGVISLLVAPEVSSIDPSVSVSSGGLRIPGIKVRRAKTTVELRDGESFTIAGLLRDDYQNEVRQYPFVGDLPVIGALFRSTGYQRNQTELVLVVTPHLVAPTLSRHATPADGFAPPSDFELFLFGAQRAARAGKSAEDQVLMGADPTKGGVDGAYGHVLR